MNSKKTLLIATLLSSVALLSACGEDSKSHVKNNPLLEPTYTKLYIKGFQENAYNTQMMVCPFYYAEPSAYAAQKGMCDKWFPIFVKRSKEELQHYNKQRHAAQLTLTVEDYRDPAFWKVISESMPKPSEKLLAR